MTTSNTKQIIFTAGLPGAGKSTVISRTEYSGLPVVDCDVFKKLHPDYDPKNPSLVHEWSAIKARELQFELMSKGKSFILDGTGTNLEKYIKWFQEARELNYKIVVVYVKVDVATSIERNARRERSVALSVILDKAGVIDGCMKVLGSLADEYKIIENN